MIGTKDKDGAVIWPRLALNGRPARTFYTMRFLDATRFVLVPPGMAADLVEQKILELAKAERQAVDGENLDGGDDTGETGIQDTGLDVRKRRIKG
jgi:hypothetical protein